VGSRFLRQDELPAKEVFLLSGIYEFANQRSYDKKQEATPLRAAKAGPGPTKPGSRPQAEDQQWNRRDVDTGNKDHIHLRKIWEDTLCLSDPLFVESFPFGGLVELFKKLFKVGRLDYVVERAQLHPMDSRFYRSMAGQHDNLGERGPLF